MPLAGLGPAHLRLLPLSYKGIKIARHLNRAGDLYTATRQTTAQSPLLPGASLWTTTQKPQGGFPFLTAFDSNIILLNYRNYKEYKALQFPMLMSQL